MRKQSMSDEQIAEAQRLREQGLSYQQISHTLGLKVHIVQYVLRPPTQAVLDRKRESSRRRTTIQNAHDKVARNRTLDDEQTAIANAMRSAGATFRQIADRLGGDASPHRVRISVDPALRAMPAAAKREKDRVHLLASHLHAMERKEAKRAAKEAERDRRESAREQEEWAWDLESPGTDDLEERAVLGDKLFANNRAARLKLIDE